MLDNATHRLGITASQFYDLLWCDYERLCYKMITDEEIRWTHTREIIAMLYNANRGKNVSAKTGRQLIPLSIDKKEEKELLTLEQHKEIIKKFSKFLKN